MSRQLAFGVLAVAVLASTLGAGVSTFAAGALPDAAWMAKGATACEKFVTPALMSAVLDDPSGVPTKEDAASCHRGGIYVKLQTTNPVTLKNEMPRIAFAHPITGIGDVAYWNDAGATTAAKAPDRGCVVQAILAVATHQAKLTGEALAQKLGAVCNQLFALR